MKIEQRLWQRRHGWRVLGEQAHIAPSLVLYFAAPGTLDDGTRFAELRLHIWRQLHSTKPRHASAPREVA